MSSQMPLSGSDRNPQDLLAVPAELQDAAGVITFWGLRGVVDRQDLVDSWVSDGMNPDLLPSDPSPESVLWRAAQASIPPGARMLVRPLKARGCFELVREEVVAAEGVVKERIQHSSELRGRILKAEGKVPEPALDPADHPLAKAVLSNFRLFEGTLTLPDVSGWLVRTVTSLCSAVVLRDRGGFYFVPRDRVELWRRVERAISAAGDHKVYEIPAMRTREAVEAICDALRKEAEDEIASIEAWLKDEAVASTRGVNAYSRAAQACVEKLASYEKLLGVGLLDLSDRLVQLKGAVMAAHLVNLKVPA